MVTWGAANEAVLARIDESRRAQVSSQIWAVARTAAANIRRQVGEGARGKRVAEWPAGDAGAPAPQPMAFLEVAAPREPPEPPDVPPGVGDVQEQREGFAAVWQQHDMSYSGGMNDARHHV